MILLFSTADSDSPGQCVYTTSWKGLVVKNMGKTLRMDEEITSIGVVCLNFSGLDPTIEYFQPQLRILPFDNFVFLASERPKTYIYIYIYSTFEVYGPVPRSKYREIMF